jgi:hypothetical protein
MFDRELRRDRAGLLAAVAVLGLVAAPLVHAEMHWREAHPDEAERAALIAQWEAGSRDPSDRLADALARVHGARPPAAPRGPGHSHGPGGAHGSGSLAHFSLALHAAPAAPSIAPRAEAFRAPRALTPQRRGTLAYLIPVGSQGPPRRR